MSRPVVGIGEILWDMLPGGKQIGGAPANFAFHATQLGANGKIVSAVGNDDLGNEILQTLEAKGLSAEVACVANPTGQVNVDPSQDGEGRYHFTEDCAWDHVPFTGLLAEIADKTAAVCFGTLAQRHPQTRHTVQLFLDAIPSDSLKIFDVNLRQHFYSKELIRDSLRLCNLLKASDEEVNELARLFALPDTEEEARCRRLMALFDIPVVIITRGAEGSSVYSNGQTLVRPAESVEVADTVGAGDSFTAAFTVALLRGKSLEEAHALATQVSAYVCTQAGATPLLPTAMREQAMNG